MIISFILNCIVEIKRLYREYKKMSDTDKSVLHGLATYYISLTLIPLVLYCFLDINNVFYRNHYFLILCMMGLSYNILSDLKLLMKNTPTLERFSKKLKYYGKQKSILAWKNYMTGGRYSEEK